MTTIKMEIVYQEHQLFLWNSIFDILWYIGLLLLIVLVYKKNTTRYQKYLLVITSCGLMCFAKGAIMMNPALSVEIIYNLGGFYLAVIAWLMLLKGRHYLWLLAFVPMMTYEVGMSSAISTVPFVWFWLLQLSMLVVPIRFIKNHIIHPKNKYLIYYPKGLLRDLDTGIYYGGYNTRTVKRNAFCKLETTHNYKVCYNEAITHAGSVENLIRIAGFDKP